MASAQLRVCLGLRKKKKRVTTWASIRLVCFHTAFARFCPILRLSVGPSCLPLTCLLWDLAGVAVLSTRLLFPLNPRRASHKHKDPQLVRPARYARRLFHPNRIGFRTAPKAHSYSAVAWKKDCAKPSTAAVKRDSKRQDEKSPPAAMLRASSGSFRARSPWKARVILGSTRQAPGLPTWLHQAWGMYVRVCTICWLIHRGPALRPKEGRLEVWKFRRIGVDDGSINALLGCLVSLQTSYSKSYAGRWC